MEPPSGFDYDLNSDEETEEVTETIPPRAAARNTGGESLGHIQEEAKIEEGYVNDTVARAPGHDASGMGLYGELREAKAMQDRPVPVEFRRSHAIEAVTPPGSVQYGGAGAAGAAGGALTQHQHFSSSAGSDQVGGSVQSIPPAEVTPDSAPMAVAEPYSDPAARQTDSSGGSPFVMHTTETMSHSVTPTPQPPAPLPDYKGPQTNNRSRCYIILALVLLLIAVIAVAVAVPVAVTSSKRDIPVDPSPAPIESPTPAPAVPTTNPPTPETPSEVFQTEAELMAAVDAYLEDSSIQTSVAQEYGHPIGMWYVSQITIFDDLFSVVRNPKAASFDESLQDWNVSRATSMSRMFRSATRFNQDLSSWRIDKVTKMEEMFKGATSFNQNLCAWQPVLTNGNVDVTDMFDDTECEVESDPELSTTDFPGGFVCAACPTGPTTFPTMAPVAPTPAPTSLPPTPDVCNEEGDDLAFCGSELPGDQFNECIDCVRDAIPEGSTCEAFEAAMCEAIESCSCGDCSDEMAEFIYCLDREIVQCSINCTTPTPTIAPTPATPISPGLLLPGCVWQQGSDASSGVCADFCGTNSSLTIAYNGSSYLCSIDGCAEDVFDCTFLYQNQPEKLCNACIDNGYRYCFQLFGENEEICLYPDFSETSNSFANISLTTFCQLPFTSLDNCRAELEGCQDAWFCEDNTVARNCRNVFEDPCAAISCHGICSGTNATDPYAPWTPEKGKGFKCTTDREEMMTCKDDHFVNKKDAEGNEIVRFSFALTCPINLPDGSLGCTCEIADCECPAGVADCPCTEDTTCRTCSFALVNGTMRVAYDCSNALKRLSGGQCAGYKDSGECILLDETGCVWDADRTSASCQNYCGANSDLSITYNGTSYLCSIAGCTEEPFDCTYLYMNDREKLCNACIKDGYVFCVQFYGRNETTCVAPDSFGETPNPFANLTFASTCPVPFTHARDCGAELEGCQSATRCQDDGTYAWNCSNVYKGRCAAITCGGLCFSNEGNTSDPYAPYTPLPEVGFRCTTDADILTCKDEEFLAFTDESDNEIAVFSYAFTCPVNNNGYFGCSCEIADCHCPEGVTDCACDILQDKCSCSFSGTNRVRVSYDCRNALRELPGDQCAGYNERGCIQF